MCEALIRVADKVNDTSVYLDAKCLKRGDIVVLVDDGWTWSAAEQTNPAWRIVRLPGVPVSKMAAFLGPEVDTDPTKPSAVLRRRAFKFNVDAATLPAAVKTYLADDTRAVPAISVTLTDAQIAALKVAKTPLVDPGVL